MKGVQRQAAEKGLKTIRQTQVMTVVSANTNLVIKIFDPAKQQSVFSQGFVVQL